MANGCCSQSVKVSKIKVAENGKQAVILNPARDVFVRTQVDGCLVEQATSCDWLVVKENSDGVLIELKGCDVSKALDQIVATFEFLKASGGLTGRMAALVVCRKPSTHPIFTSKLQRVRNRLSSEFRAPLHVVTGNFEYQMERLLSHMGPF